MDFNWQGDPCEDGDGEEGEVGRAEQASRGGCYTFSPNIGISYLWLKQIISTGCQIEPGETSEGGGSGVYDDQWISLINLNINQPEDFLLKLVIPASNVTEFLELCHIERSALQLCLGSLNQWFLPTSVLSLNRLKVHYWSWVMCKIAMCCLYNPKISSQECYCTPWKTGGQYIPFPIKDFSIPNL